MQKKTFMQKPVEVRMSVQKQKGMALAPYARTLLEDGRVVIPFQSFPWERTANLFEKLLKEESADYIQSWELSLWDDDEADDGILVRSDEAHDKKTFFHFRPWLPTQLRKHGVNAMRHRELIENAALQHHACIEHMRALVCALDREVPEYRLRERFYDVAFRKRSVLRYLWYESIGTKPGDILAREHRDKGCITFHIWERFPGLEYTEQRIPYLAGEKTILAFWGKKAEELSGGHLKALYHRVVNNGESSTAARMACVFFGHIAP